MKKMSLLFIALTVSIISNAQYQGTFDDRSSNDIFWNYIKVGVLIFVGIAITRWIYGIPTIIRNLKWQTKILEKMAQQQGIPKEDIETILNDKEPTL